MLLEQFKFLFPHAKNPISLFAALLEQMELSEINTPNRIAAFIAQCGHETAGWKVFTENLNYSEKALNTLFHKYFAGAGLNAADYARQPEKIANVIYASRMGNNDSSDGWKYHGRGAIQLTGKDNYKQFSRDCGIPAYYLPELITDDMNNIIRTGTWYWTKHNLNDYADKSDIKGITKKINGGYIGLAERTSLYHKILNCMNGNSTEFSGTISAGSIGSYVVQIQAALGLNADGIFGAGTDKAVKTYQSEHNLIVDGIVGTITFNAIMS